MSAPTLVAVNGDGFVKYEGVGEINRYCQSLVNERSALA